MNRWALSICFTLFLFPAIAQQEDHDNARNIAYLNRLYAFPDINTDSALFYAHALAKTSIFRPSLRTLMNIVLPQTFNPFLDTIADPDEKQRIQQRRKADYEFINKLATDPDTILSSIVQPLNYWVSIIYCGNDQKKAALLTYEFITTQWTKDDLYADCICRYTLLISNTLLAQHRSDSLARQLFTMTYDYLNNYQSTLDPDTASYMALEKRAEYRYLFSWCNHQLGNKEQAFQYSPDLIDRGHMAAYDYDRFLLTGNGDHEDNLYMTEYLAFEKVRHAPDDEIRDVLVKMALADTRYKDSLHFFYDAHYTGSENFDTYWTRLVNDKRRTAPGFRLQQLDGQFFDLAANSKKWVLLDFWGTWCGPCREELPDMQTFYKEIISPHPEKLSLLSIACHDLEPGVRSFLQKNNYSFPVAMADDQIERNYHIQSYPSKILITPEGKYIIIPFGQDWIARIKQYCDIH